MTAAFRLGPASPASVLAASALALSACGDRQAASSPAPSAPAAPSGAAPAEPPPVLRTRAETRQFRDWSATCGNDGTCWAFGFAPEFAAGWVRIALAAGPEAQPDIRFGYWPDAEAGAAKTVALVIDGRSYPATLDAASEAEAPIGLAAGDPRPLIDAMIRMGASLDLRVVAEGIEDPEQLDALAELNCGLGQGYLFARPLPAAEVARYLAAHHGPGSPSPPLLGPAPLSLAHQA